MPFCKSIKAEFLLLLSIILNSSCRSVVAAQSFGQEEKDRKLIGSWRSETTHQTITISKYGEVLTSGDGVLRGSITGEGGKDYTIADGNSSIKCNYNIEFAEGQKRASWGLLLESAPACPASGMYFKTDTSDTAAGRDLNLDASACFEQAGDPLDAFRPLGYPGVQPYNINPGAALPSCRRARETYPVDPSLMLAEANTLAKIAQPEDISEMERLLQAASELHNYAAQYRLAERKLLSGQLPEAKALYQSSAEGGIAQSWLKLAVITYSGERDHDPLSKWDDEKDDSDFALLVKGAEAGDPEAMMNAVERASDAIFYDFDGRCKRALPWGERVLAQRGTMAKFQTLNTIAKNYGLPNRGNGEIPPELFLVAALSWCYLGATDQHQEYYGKLYVQNVINEENASWFERVNSFSNLMFYYREIKDPVNLNYYRHLCLQNFVEKPSVCSN